MSLTREREREREREVYFPQYNKYMAERKRKLGDFKGVGHF